MSELKKATFGAGCFWGVEELFRKMNGVKDTKVGYEGGNLKNPTYEDVCSDKSGHAEVVEVMYAPSEVSYEELLKVFWSNHNPTTLNRQGPDVGTQYRSAIFYHDDEQRRIAEKSKIDEDASKRWNVPVVTSIEPATAFWIAEDYHQRYLEKRGLDSCHI